MITRTFSLILTTIYCATASKEIVQNGGFEDGTFGWGSMGKTFFKKVLMIIKFIIGCHISVGQSDVFSGKSSLKVKLKLPLNFQ